MAPLRVDAFSQVMGSLLRDSGSHLGNLAERGKGTKGQDMQGGQMSCPYGRWAVVPLSGGNIPT